jgi:hypothetical protein
VAGHATCDCCGADVDWVGVARAARALNVSERRVRQLLANGRFPNAYKYQPVSGEPALWHIPLADLAAFMEARGTPFTPLAQRQTT